MKYIQVCKLIAEGNGNPEDRITQVAKKLNVDRESLKSYILRKEIDAIDLFFKNRHDVNDANWD